MAAPSATVWGSIAGSYGRIGIYRSLSNTATKTTVTVQVWFWAKYSCYDSSNTLYYNILASSGSATTSAGSKNISVDVETGSGWSTSNQQLLATYTYSYDRGTSGITRYLYAKLANVDRVGATMYANTSFTVPALDSYAVKYDANGGSGAPSAQTKWYGKDLTLSSTTPTRTGYTFKGWATSAGGSVAYDPGDSYTGNAALTLYAVWQINTFAVKYDANGGTGAPAAQTKTYGTALTLSSTKPTRENYNFLGWGTSAGATSVAYAAGASYTANAAITLYAIWELAYVVPTITGYKVSRCDSAGNLNDFGTYAKVEFDWECCQLTGSNPVASIVIEWKEQTAAAYPSGNKATVSASGNSGAVSQVIGADALSIDHMYTIRVTVTDSMAGSFSRAANIPTAAFTIDFLAGGKGVAVGKAATVEDAFDVYMQTIIRGSQDASGTAASGQLIIGDPDGYHIAMDNNEIMAKANATTPGNISINYEGGNVGLGGPNSKIALNGNCYMKNGKALFGANTDGADRLLVQLNASNQMFFGYGGYSNNEGESFFDGNVVNIRSKGNINVTCPGTFKVGNDGVLRIRKLWENASPTSSFAMQTISLDLSGYQKVYIDYLGDSGNGIWYTAPSWVGAMTALQFHTQVYGYATSEVPYIFSRIANVTTSGITFNSCFLRLTGNGSYQTVQNSCAIPYRIYGIKGVS